jgi:hypothetical protein
MHYIGRASLVFAALLAFGCAPLVTGHTRAKGVDFWGECRSVGKDTYVTVRVWSTGDHAPWVVEWTGDTPEDLTIDNGGDMTVLRWKVGEDHRKSISILPYELKITSGGTSYQATVAFQTTSQTAIFAVIQVLGAAARLH